MKSKKIIIALTLVLALNTTSAVFALDGNQVADKPVATQTATITLYSTGPLDPPVH